MGHQDQGGGRLAAQVQEQIDDLLPRRLVQVAGGLVGEQDLGPRGIGAGDGHPLLFTPGKLTGVMAGAGRQAHPLQGLVRAPRGLVGTGQLQGQEDVLPGGEIGQELEILKDEADPPGAQGSATILVQAVEDLAAQPDLPGGGVVEPGQQPQQGGLA